MGSVNKTFRMAWYLVFYAVLTAAMGCKTSARDSSLKDELGSGYSARNSKEKLSLSMLVKSISGNFSSSEFETYYTGTQGDMLTSTPREKIKKKSEVSISVVNEKPQLLDNPYAELWEKYKENGGVFLVIRTNFGGKIEEHFFYVSNTLIETPYGNQGDYFEYEDFFKKEDLSYHATFGKDKRPTNPRIYLTARTEVGGISQLLSIYPDQNDGIFVSIRRSIGPNSIDLPIIDSESVTLHNKVVSAEFSKVKEAEKIESTKN